MEFASAIALVLLTLVGYSSGVVLAGRGGQPVPGLRDLLLVAILWVLALAVRGELGRWLSLLVWLPVGGLTGAARTALGGVSMGAPRLAGEYQRSHEAAPVQGRWRRFALGMGNFQSRMLISFFYFIVLAPFAAMSRLSADPLRRRAPAPDGGWLVRPPQSTDLPAARSQF